MAEGPKSRVALDLDQIERQLRSSQQPGPSKSDPLAELARIVGQDDPFRALLAEPQAPSSHGRAPSAYPGADPYAPRMAADTHHASAHAYPAEDEAAFYGQNSHAQSSHAYASAQYEAEYYEEDEAGYEPQAAFAEAAPRRRRSRMRLVAVAVLGLAVLGGSTYFALRGGDHALMVGGEPPVIRADAGPSKVPPLNPGGIDIPNQNKQIYEGGLQDSQTRVVSGEEQPIDVRQIGRGPGAGNATDVLGEPRRVRTVSIRPDGAIIGAEAAPATRPNTPAFPQSAATPPQPAAASVPSNATAMAQVAAAAPLNILPPQRPRDVTVTPSSPQVAGTPSRGIDAPPAGPLQIGPDVARSRSEPRIAAMAPASLREPTETSAAPGASTGSYLAQIGVRSSDSDARAQFDRLQQRFPIELSGFSPIIQQAESNGRTIYRIRVGPLSKQDADALCARLKASNGECFRAKPES
jgi:hypothetical protein